MHNEIISSYLTVNSGVAERTRALICSVTVETCAAIEAGLGVTLVDVILAVAASESRQTEAGEGVDAVHTGATVEAGAEASQDISCYNFEKVERQADLVLCCRRLPVRAVVGVDLAVYATEAQRTGAGVAVDTVGAVRPVLAGITLTLIYVLFASAATKPGRTGAGIRVDAIMAQTTITTWI